MGLLDIFGGGSGSADDPYADILTPAQRNQMQVQGLLAMAGAFADAGMPSRLPIPFGAALGKAAAALGTGQDAGMTAAIANAYKAQQVRDLRAKAALQGKLSPIFQDLLDRIRSGQGVGPGSPAIPQPAGPGAGGGGGGGGAIPAGAGGGGLLSPDFSLGSDYASGLTPEPTERTSRFDVGSLDYPADQGGMRAGGGLLAERPDAGIGTTIPSSEYAPGGRRYPFKDLGVVPGGAVGGAAPAAASGAAPGPTSDEFPPMPTPPGFVRLPGGGLKSVPLTPAEIRDIERGTSGSSTAPAEPDAGAGGDTSSPAASDTVPAGGGLLGVAPDLRAPIERSPFAVGNARGETPEIRQAAYRAAIAAGIDPTLLRGLVKVESGFKPGIVSPAGAVGLTQLMPGTAAGLGVTNSADIGQNLQGGANYLRQGLEKYGGDVNKALMFYHGGPNENAWGPITRAYPGAVTAAARGLSGGDLPPLDEVIPSGPGAGGNRPPIVQAQYRPQGGAAVPGMPQLAAPSSLPGLAAPSTLPQLAAPGAAPPLGAGGKIPGLNMTPQELAVIDAMAESAGLGNPFKGLLDTYYKSPGYLQESAGATETGKRAVSEPSDIRIQAAKARLDLIQKLSENALTLDQDNNVVEIPGMRQMLGKTAAEIEEAKQRATSQFQTVEATVLGPNGERTPQKMTQYEFTYREQQRAKNAAMGLSPQPGDIVSAATPESIKSSELGVTAGWKALQDTHAAELAANRSDQQLGQIAEAMRGFTPGKTAEWRLTWGQYLKDAGFKIDGVSDGEIMQQAQRRLQLLAANVHEGSVSNFERGIYGETVTQLTNTPEGIVKAIDIQQRLNDYDRKVAQIHRDTIVNGIPNLVEAQSRIAKLGPPLSPGELSALQEIRAGKVPGPGQGGGAAALPPDAKQIGTFQGKPVYQMPDGSRKVLQ